MHSPRRFACLCLALVLLLSIIAAAPAAASPAPQGGDTVYLPLLIREGTPQPPPPPAGSPSTELIQKALDDGQIDDETALLYQVYAAFNDSRLPASFQGDDRLVEDSHVMAAVAEQYASLSAATQAKLAPFRLPPNAPGSWYAQRQAAAAAAPAGDWALVDTANGKARVWYGDIWQGESVKAAAVAAAIDATIWPGLETLMNRVPLADTGLPNSGGDGRLDIYLVRDMADMAQEATTRGLTVPYRGCDDTPAWIILNSGRDLGSGTSGGMLQTAAHELMHAWQFSYNVAAACGSYNWLAEATAKWAEDYLYPQAQSEQPYASEYLNTVYWPLEQWHGLRAYGAYLYFFFTTRSEDRPSVVRRVWSESESYDSLEATDMATPGSFLTKWPEFALYNWNQAPLDSYRQWDGLTARVSPLGDQVIDVKLNGGTDMQYTMPTALEHLSIHYRHYRFPDDGVRSVTFFNGLTYKLSKQTRDGSEFFVTEGVDYELTKGASVQALVKVADQPWKVEDWTGSRYQFFCRDERAGRLEELVLIYSYSEHENPTYKMQPAGLDPTLYVTNIGCWRYKGTVSWQGSNAYASEQGSVTDVIWERDDSKALTDYALYFKAIEGNVSFTSSYSNNNCSRQESADFPLKPADNTLLIMQRWMLSGDEYRAYDAMANSTGDLNIVEAGGGCSDPGSSVSPFGDWLSTHEGVQVRADGSLHGEGEGHGWRVNDMDRTWTWSFTPMREP